MTTANPLPFPKPSPAKLVGLAVGVTALGLISLLFTRDHSPVATVWLSNGLILFALLRAKASQWSPYLAVGLIGSLVARAAAGDPLSETFVVSGLNIFEVVICAALMRRLLRSDLDLTRPRHLAVFVLSAGVLAPAASGVLGATAFVALLGVPAMAVFSDWFPAHALGLLLLTPALLTIRTSGARELVREMAAPWHALPALVLVSSLAVVFGQTQYPLLFLVFPALTLIAFRWSAAWVAAALVATTAVAIGATLGGFGPAALIEGSLAKRMVILQLFLATSTLVALSLTAVVTSRRRSEESLRETIARSDALAAELADSEKRYRLLAANASDLIVCFDAEARFTYLSPAIEPLLGYCPDELLGKQTRAIMHPEDYRRSLGTYEKHLKSEQAHEPFHFEYRAIRKDGGEVWLSGHPRAVFDANGAIVEFQDTVRDVSERKALEAELSEARDAAEEAARVKGEFMANMSHEIRTPLTAILGFTSLLTERIDLAPEARSHLDRVRAGGRALLSIVNDVLDFSKLEAGQVVIRPRPTVVQQTLAETLALFEPQAGAKGIGLQLALPADLPVARLDPDRLQQVLLNLIGNAVKFTEQGAVTLRASYDEAAQRLTVRVEDTGAGMTEVQQAQLFLRFSQVDASMTRQHGGTGLGLAICRGLVEAMGGEVSVASVPGDGSTFSFSIDAPVCEVAESDPVEAMFDLSGVRVLVADDNPLNRDLVRSLLLPLGAEVEVAVDGAEALELAMSLPFDVILMDLRMPRIDGIEATLRLRGEPGPNQTIPILAFTAEHAHSGVTDLAQKGFDGLVTKPIVRERLARAISESQLNPFAPVVKAIAV